MQFIQDAKGKLHEINFTTKSFSCMLFGKKALEVELHWVGKKDWNSIFRMDFGWTVRGDHCGIYFELNICRFEFEFNIYDTRHWNYEKDRFYLPGEEAKEYEKENEN